MSKLVDGVKAVFKKAVDKVSGVHVYDMSTKEARQRQVKRDFERAKTEKIPYTQKMVEHNNYYNNKPYTLRQAQELQSKLGINFTPPVLPDGYIQVESQLDITVPTSQFSGREGLEPGKAKEREDVAEYIMYNNNVDDLNLDNERALNITGNAFWKVSWDGSIECMGVDGDIVIGNPDGANIFPDPNAYDVDDCEFLDYAYRQHRRKLRRIHGEIIDTITNDGDRSTTEIYGNNQNQSNIDDETLLVIEHWYRDDEGDIACSVQINYVEVKWIEKYWVNTRFSGNKMYPIIKYGKVPVLKSFWDKGEIETIKDLIDAGNREFVTAILNDAFMANDIVIIEKDNLAEGYEFGNVPGENVMVKPNMGATAVRRLGGISENGGILQMIEFIHEKIQETNGNYDSSQGKEPVRVTTSSGIAQLNEKADVRKVTKKAGRTEGFKRLAQLVDWSALEFFNMDRMIMVGAEKPDQPRQAKKFNSDNHKMMVTNGEGETAFEKPYYPKVDIRMVVGDGIKKSKAFTLAATQELAQTPVTPENLAIVLSQVDLLDMPNKEIIKNQMITAVNNLQQRLQAQAQPQQPPTPSQSITFKDMPAAGKIQMAGEVGIQLKPEDFVTGPEPVDNTQHENAVGMAKLQSDAMLNEMKMRHEKELEHMRQEGASALLRQKTESDMLINEQKARHTSEMQKNKPKGDKAS